MLGQVSYSHVYRHWIEHLERFRAEYAGTLQWDRSGETVLTLLALPFRRWLARSEITACHNGVGRHVEAGFLSDPALFHENPVTNILQRFSYFELQQAPARRGGASVPVAIAVLFPAAGKPA
jgi:hypothetical protein